MTIRIGKTLKIILILQNTIFDRFRIGDTLHLELSLGRSDTKKAVYY